MTDKIRETEQKIADETDVVRKMNLTIELISLYYYHDRVRGVTVADEAFKLAQKIGHEVGMARAILGKGNCNVALGNYREALEQLAFAQSELHRLGEKKFESTAFLNMSKMREAMGDFQTALEYKYESLKLAKESGHIPVQSINLANISLAHCKLNNIDKALEFAHESLNFAKEHKDDLGWANALVQLGLIHIHYVKDAKQGLQYLNEALAKIDENPVIRDHWSLATIRENQALEYYKLQRYEDALQAAEESLAIYQKMGDGHRQPNPLLILSLIYSEQRRFDESLQCLQQGESLIIKTGYKAGMPNVHETYVEYYKKMGDYAKALEHYEKFHQLKEELFNEESQNKIHNLSILHDVERTKSEKELAEKEREIVRLKNVELSSALEEVRALNERLVQLDKEKNEVLGVVAHDLKSPLSGIRMVSSMLKEYHAKMPGEELTRQLETVEQTSDRMLGIVTNLLDVHAIESGMVYSKREDVDVVSVIESLVSGYREVAGRKRIELHTSYSTSELSINGSREAVQQISENLLSNAIKFSPEGSRVYVSVEQVGETIRVTVRDEGPGVSRKDREAMFGKYGRLSARPTGGESSTGLGLWIVKKAVESLGGAIRCESTARKKGTTFVVELPAVIQGE